LPDSVIPSPGTKNYSTDDSRLSFLIEIRNFAKKNCVNLMIVSVSLLAQQLAYRGTVRQIAEKLGIEFIQGNDAVGQGKYFQDRIHLNREGAKIFSDYLGENVPKVVSNFK
jgi:hypothetical protein